MKLIFKNLMLVWALLMLGIAHAFAQAIPTLEMPRNATNLAISNYGQGTSITPVVTEFKNDNLNSNAFSVYTPQLTFSVALANQQFTGLSYGTNNYNGTGLSTLQTTGLVFGAGPSLASDPVPQGANAYNRYNIIGEYGGGGGPTNIMFTSNPNATGAELGTGINVANASSATLNGAVEVFTTAQALYNNPSFPIGSRAYFGDLVLTFNRPVVNPVIHFAGLGGAYRYLPFGLNDLPGNYRSTFFSTELELANPGLTSTLMSGNTYMTLSGNNVLNNNDVNPNGGSVFDPTEAPFNNVGAASGSIRINGTVQQLVYRVYLQGGTGSDFAWSAAGIGPGGVQLITGALRNPFTGDIWYVAASLDKPTQQISGNVFNDKDGLTDNNVNQSLGLPNTKTNVTGQLFANLLNSAGLVVASVPVTPEGNYLFNGVPVGSYTVQLSKFPSAGTYVTPVAPPATVLPDGWVNTGEFNGNTAGNDGSINGISASVTVSTGGAVTDVNFGIERLPESVSFTTAIKTPKQNDVIRLDTIHILEGSDPEDLPLPGGLLTGKTVKITTLPTNTSLRYNGNPVLLNQVIPNFDMALLTIVFDQLIPQNVAGSTQFNFAYVDAAGIPDPTPAVYQLTWPPVVLTIKLAEFTVVANGCSANLTWKTTSEVDADRMEIEVSTSSNTSFTNAGSVAATGNISSGKTYTFSYPMQSGVNYFFRLKLIDKDGSFKYSDVRRMNCSTGKIAIAISPNPATDRFYITGMDAGKNNVTLIAANGQVVAKLLIVQNQGYVTISNLASGTYTVKVISEKGDVFTGKIIKE